ncbi:MAG: molybdopterin-binding protein [Paracoccus sp. (in: a-proteobacteria)]|nr:molybdopterin-binding protein [Paracoccus sp. (in: a-proteobacteria)]
MKLSARNVLKGTISSIETGAVSTIVKIDLGGGVIVTSSITKAAAEDLGLSVGDEAFAVIKASDVLVGKP